MFRATQNEDKKSTCLWPVICKFSVRHYCSLTC